MPSPLVDVDGRRLRLTNLDKVLYPVTGTTKGEVIRYYATIAPALLPHLAERPVTRKRWPDGVGTAEGPAHRESLHRLVAEQRGKNEWEKIRIILSSIDRRLYPGGRCDSDSVDKDT